MNLLHLKTLIFFLILFSLCIIIFIISVIECKHYVIKTFDVTNGKNSDKIKLVFLSDFHDKKYKNYNKKLIDDIINLNPNYILLGGDFLDFSVIQDLKNTVNYKNTFKFLDVLAAKAKENKNIKGIYFGFGNHELRLKSRADKMELVAIYNELIEKLKRNNIMLLDNNTLNLSNGIKVSGLSLFKGYYGKFFKKKEKHVSKEVLDKYFKDIDDSSFNIMLFHKPDYSEDLVDYGYDLILSGHNHGGLICLPFFGSIISPDLRLFPKYSKGMYQYNNKNILVSSGIGEHFIKIRVNNRPEICVINIK